MAGSGYRGRFAPSPSGPLHFGSLVAALASFLDARHHRGQWLLRIDDIDPPRQQAGAIDAICNTLIAHGLHWDDSVFYQSQQSAVYRRALNNLANQQRLFRCDCTRKRLANSAHYDGYCHPRQHLITRPFAWRVKASGTIVFVDRVQGRISTSLDDTGGDFIVQRKDKLWAYQLAAAVDDGGTQGITHVVRGADLLPTTARQIYLQQCLSLSVPTYLHVPIALDEAGQKLSKQNHAPALDNSDANNNLRRALAFLKQPAPPVSLHQPKQLLDFAIDNWQAQAMRPTP